MDKVVTQKQQQLANEIKKTCRDCGQRFLARYWDQELEWYIDVRNSDFCQKCHKNQPGNQ